MTYAMLFDASKCTACRGCQVACKQWNDLPGEVTKNTGSYQNPKQLSADTWLVMEFHEVENGDGLKWGFRRKACMHCLEPACVSACPVGALKKTEEGPVHYDEDRCIGCRYCMVACPFDVPTFTWDNGLMEGAVIRKCKFCVDRLGSGLEPACAKTCPPGALKFGERDELLAEAHARIDAEPTKYVGRVYGESEVGGTSILYVSHVPFEDLGLPSLGNEPVQKRSEQIMETVTPAVAMGMLFGLGGLYWVVRRRNQMAAAKAGRSGKEGS
jgi:formate dehydrogenase iron-sulfur subunit